MCREVLCISHPNKRASAVLPNWAAPAPGLGAQQEPSMLPVERGSALSLDTEVGSSIPGQPWEPLPYLQIPLGSVGTGYRV